jgi:hypothetical protein
MGMEEDEIPADSEIVEIETLKILLVLISVLDRGTELLGGAAALILIVLL